MPKQLKELRQFVAGTKSSASDTDVQEESAIYSKNIDPISEEGKLKGIKDHIKVLPKDGEVIIQITPLRSPSGYTNFSSNWTTELDDSETADLVKDADDNSLLNYDFTLQLSHRGLGVSKKEIAITMPTYSDTGNSLTFTDAQILKRHNDEYYTSIKTTLDAMAQPDMLVTLSRSPVRAGSIYPYPSDKTDFHEENDREEFIENDTHDGVDYLIGHAVPTELMPPYRKLTITFRSTFTDADSVVWDVKAIGVSIPFHTSNSVTELYEQDETYPNDEDETFDPDDTDMGAYAPIIDDSQYLPINATEMEMFTDEAKENVAFYSITYDDTAHPSYNSDDDSGAGTTYRMKVLEDLYGDKIIIDSYDKDGDPEYFDIPSQNDDVSLVKKNANTFIGLGGAETKKSKWLGKLKHKQFDQTKNEYRLLDSEVYPIDDGQAVFNLNQISYNRHGTSAFKAITNEAVYGLSEGTMFLYALDNRDTENPDSDNENLGKQFRSTTKVTFTPSGLTPSSWAYEANRQMSSPSAWVVGPTTIWNSHTHDAEKSAYWWAGDKNRPAVHMLATSFDAPNGELSIQQEYSLPINLVMDQPIIAGARVSDVIETFDSGTWRVWVLFTKSDYTPFTWDEEFVYSFDVTDINWGAGSVAAYAHTPPALKMKKEKAWDLGDNSSSFVYVDEVTTKVDFDSISHVCWEVTWDCKQNAFYYRHCDDMGEPEQEDWYHLAGRSWHKHVPYYSPHKWNLGENCGFVDTGEDGDYEINPAKLGLVDLGHEHKVGMLAHLKAKHVTKAGIIDTKKRDAWPKRWYYCYPSTCGETVDYDDTMLFFLNPEHKGVKHRRVATSFDATGGIGNQLDSNAEAFRSACYKFDAANADVNAMAMKFLGSESVTGYSGFNDVNAMPDEVSKIINTVRYLSNSGTPTYWVSVRGTQGNVTTLQRYQYDYPVEAGTDPLGREITTADKGSNDFTPMILEDLGSSCFASISADNGVNESFFFSPRQGSYIAARSAWDSTNGWYDYTGDAQLTSGEQADGYSDKYVHFLANSELKYGIYLQDGDLSGDDSGTFQAGVQYFYKMSVLYDGYQESPMTAFYFSHVPSANCKTVVMTIRLDNPAPRATHAVIYRKNNVEDFYRMVAELDLGKQWGKTDESWFRVEVDRGNLSATYESITGMPEGLKDTSVNYAISTAAAGHLFVGNCWHKDIKNGQNFIFRSQPGNYSIFNWTRDFLILPNTPVAMAYWQGRLYAFDRANMYRIDPNNMVIEDEHSGVGCFGEQSYIVTDFGLYFCDNNNMYLHNGSTVQPIGTDILKNSKYEETGEVLTNWHNINHARDPYVAYDAFSQVVKFMWEDKNGTSGSWDYNIPRNRWDLTDIPSPKAYLQGKFGERFLSDGSYFYSLNENTTRKRWTHHTPSLDFGYSTIDKKVKKVKLIFNNTTDVSSAEYTIKFISDDVELKSITHPTATPSTGKYKDDEHEREYKVPKNVTKKFRIKIEDCNVEIDSIGITYTQRKVD